VKVYMIGSLLFSHMRGDWKISQKSYLLLRLDRYNSIYRQQATNQNLKKCEIMENVDLEKIKDRIAKLLRMSQDASSPNEAAIAAGRARALMDKYQIEAFDANNQVKEVFGV
jgi:hypothetical protein